MQPKPTRSEWYGALMTEAHKIHEKPAAEPGQQPVWEGGVDDHILQQVEDCIEIRELKDLDRRRKANTNNNVRRCSICTFKLDSAEHDRCCGDREAAEAQQLADERAERARLAAEATAAEAEAARLAAAADIAGTTAELGDRRPALRCRSVTTQGADWADKLKPCARSGHSAVFYPAERGNMGSADQLIIFGGFAFGSFSVTGDFVPSSAFKGYSDVVAHTRDLHYVNEVHHLNLQTSTWARLECAGEAPCPRHSHSATLAGARVWVFGGRTLGGAVLHDMRFLDMSDWDEPCWHAVALPAQCAPPRRALHAAVLVGGGGEGSSIMIMGGRDEDGALLDDTWLYDIDRALALEEQTSHVLREVMTQQVWSRPHAVGQCPTGLAGHAISLLPGGGGVLVLGVERQAVLEATQSGGGGGEGMPARLGAWELDLATMIWARANSPPFTGDVPRWVPRSTLAVSGRICLVFGGEGVLALLDLGTREWMEPRIVGEVPAPRLGHTATVVDSRVVCFGGYFEDSSKPTDTLVCFEM